MSSTEQREFIRIVNYINPHLFYYKRNDNQIILELYRLECKIVEYSVRDRKRPSFQRGEIVAVFIAEWDKWVRARIECDSSDGQQFLLWTIDYGLPMVAASTSIIALADELAYDPLKVVFLGGVVDCVPSDMQFDVQDRRAKPRPRQKWSPKAIESIGNILQNAAVIEFTPKILQFKGRHNFGELVVHSKAKYRIEVAQTLYDLTEAMHSNDFINDLDAIETLNDEPWLTADSKVKISKNIFTTCTGSAGATIEFKLKLKSENGGARYDDYEHMCRQNFPDMDEISSITKVNAYFDRSASVIGDAEYQSEEYEQQVPQAKSSVQNRLMQSNTSDFGGDEDSELTINQVNMSCKAGREMRPITIPREPHQPIGTVLNPSIGNNNRSLKDIRAAEHGVTPPRSDPLNCRASAEFIKKMEQIRAQSSISVVPETFAGYGGENATPQIRARSSVSVIPSTFGGYGRENVPNPNHMEATRLAASLLKDLHLSDQHLNGNRSDELKINRNNNFDRHLNARSDIQPRRDAPRNLNGANNVNVTSADRRNDNRNSGQRQMGNNGQSNRNVDGRSRNARAINDRLNK